MGFAEVISGQTFWAATITAAGGIFVVCLNHWLGGHSAK